MDLVALLDIRLCGLIYDSLSYDALETSQLAKDARIYLPSATIHHLQIENSWHLKGCKIQKRVLVENRKVLLGYKNSTNSIILMALVRQKHPQWEDLSIERLWRDLI